MFFYQLLIIPATAAIIAQGIKLATDKIKGNFTWHHLIHDYGGMPSSHSAFVSSLAAEIGFTQGFNSAIFVFALVFAIIVIRDASGLRNYLSKANHEINKLNNNNNLNEKIGHKRTEILIGCILGIAIAAIGVYLM
ncbi:MAG: divergent PAP2 family protein [bacterium]